MREEVLDIAKKLYHNHLTIETGTDLLLGLFSVSGSCPQLIADIEKLSRYDIYGTETEGSVEVEHCNDGDNIDADELYKILDNYR